MLRRLGAFLLWLGIFGLFLTFAAYSIGETRLDLAAGSVFLLALAWLALRRPAAATHPEARFRTLRKLGLVGRAEDQAGKRD